MLIPNRRFERAVKRVRLHFVSNIRKASDPEADAELKRSLITKGQLVPLIVGEMPGVDWYRIIEGHRRVAAGLDEYDCIVVPHDVSELNIKILQSVLDLQRQSVREV